ncbi:hypothetical protein BDQ17DRAFT_1429484 [Cyathus striatus]|nr:hypothetical protein BDQ17DRAFT_1429484 [Cyathus striatus]
MSLPLEIQGEIFKRAADANMASVSPWAQSCVEPILYEYIKICKFKTAGYLLGSKFLNIAKSRTYNFAEIVKCIEFKPDVPIKVIIKVLSICKGIEFLRYCPDEFFDDSEDSKKMFSLIVELSSLQKFKTNVKMASDFRDYFIDKNGTPGFENLTVPRILLYDSLDFYPLHWLPALERLELIVSNGGVRMHFNSYMLRTLREIVDAGVPQGLNSIHIEYTQYRNCPRFNREEWKAVDSRISADVIEK